MTELRRGRGCCLWPSLAISARLGPVSGAACTGCAARAGSGRRDRRSQSPFQSEQPSRCPQVQFEEREDAKACTITIRDDTVFEGTESFTVELSAPAYALLGNVTRATVTITDTEDEPTLQFASKTHHVSESAGVLSAAVERKGGSCRARRTFCAAMGHGRESGSAGTAVGETCFHGVTCFFPLCLRGHQQHGVCHLLHRPQIGQGQQPFYTGVWL